MFNISLNLTALCDSIKSNPIEGKNLGNSIAIGIFWWDTAEISFFIDAFRVQKIGGLNLMRKKAKITFKIL